MPTNTVEKHIISKQDITCSPIAGIGNSSKILKRKAMIIYGATREVAFTLMLSPMFLKRLLTSGKEVVVGKGVLGQSRVVSSHASTTKKRPVGRRRAKFWVCRFYLPTAYHFLDAPMLLKYRRRTKNLVRRG
jgi:hypothetical protein